ncbi:MAG TPA: transcriptional regulator, partial [Halomonas sp.]|nr:transcriptional regulator [Halomonas sp.]
MHRFVLPYLWPILTGLLLAAVVLLAFPEQLPNPFRQTPPVTEEAPTAFESPPALVPTTSSEPSASRPAPDIKQAAPLSRQQGPASYSNAVNQAAPAVVNIYSSRIVERDQHPLMSDPFFNQFFSGDDATTHQRMLSSLGSGVIVSNDGYVLTNHHVINGADQIQVALRDGRETLAEVIGTDPESDLAVLRIDLDDLPVIELADSEEVAVGDVALAIGNPFGVGQTVTMGI